MFYLYCLKCFCENEMLRVRKARDTSNHQIYFHVWQILYKKREDWENLTSLQKFPSFSMIKIGKVDKSSFT